MTDNKFIEEFIKNWIKILRNPNYSFMSIMDAELQIRKSIPFSKIRLTNFERDKVIEFIQMYGKQEIDVDITLPLFVFMGNLSLTSNLH